MTAHLPRRPSWTCLGCGAPWPCHTRRSQLLAEYDGAPVSLGLLMAGYLTDVIQDLPGAIAHDVHWRFLGWLRSRR